VTAHCCVCIQLGRYERPGTETVTHGGRDYQACGEHAPLLAHGLQHVVAAIRKTNPTEHAT
jgi:hypothetical protein